MAASLFQRSLSTVLAVMFGLLIGTIGSLAWAMPAEAITAPELRSQFSMQDLQPDMRGRNLQQAAGLDGLPDSSRGSCADD